MGRTVEDVTVEESQIAALRERLADGCHRGCDYDEAEGGLVSHCADCQHWITSLAYMMFVSYERGLPDPAETGTDRHGAQLTNKKGKT